MADSDVERFLSQDQDVRALLQSWEKSAEDVERTEVTRMEQEEARIARIRESLAKLDDISGNMSDLLSTMDSRLDALRERILPIHQLTQELSNTHDNVEKTVKEVRDVLSQYDDIGQVQEALSNGVQVGVTAFMNHLEKANKILEFFSTGKAFQNSDKILGRLRASRDKGVAESLELLSRNLERAHPRSAFSASDEGAFTYEAETVAAVSFLIERLVRLGVMDSVVHVYTQRRLELLKGALSLLPLEEMTEKHSPQRYVKSSHKYLSFVRVAVLITEAERGLCKRVFPATKWPWVFMDVIGPTFDLFISSGEKALSPDKRTGAADLQAFALFDILQSLTDARPRLAIALEGVDRRLVTALNTLVGRYQNSARMSFDARLLDSSIKSLTPDGTVHHTTTETIGYLRRLLDYRGTIESLIPVSVMQQQDETEPSGGLGSYCVDATRLLRANLANAARGHKERVLQLLFLVNNENYIRSSLRGSQLIGAVGTLFAEEVAQHLSERADEYITATWRKCHSVLAVVLPRGTENPEPRAIKQAFSQFNTHFEEQCNLQRKYAVADADLRRRLRERLHEEIVPVYEDFLSRSSKLSFSRNPEKYVVYGTDSLREKIMQFFSEH